MTKISIEEVQKTDIAGLFTICFEGEDATELKKRHFQELTKQLLKYEQNL